MAGTGRTVYIAGAGIAGLTLALALAKFGATVIVLERANAIQEVGAGLQLSPNARRILDRLGLERPIASKSFEPDGIDVYPYGARRPLVSLALKGEMRARFGAPYVVMHRADLAAALHQACRRFASIDIMFGVRSYDSVTHARGVSIDIEEADGRTRSARGFAFVGADGVNSPTRTRILKGPDAAYSGYTAWRAMLPAAALDGLVSAESSSVLFGPGYHAVLYPLPLRRQYNAVLVTKAKEAAILSDPPREPTLPWAALPSAAFRALSQASDNWGYWPLSTVETDIWHEGGVGLIGDAAHAMLPFQAQGAAMAIEDAAILAPLLMTEAEPQSAFQRYVALRRERVERVQELSRSNGFAFHLEWPMTLARDAVLGLEGPRGHLKRLGWLYGYDAAPDPELAPPPRIARNPEVN